ncbi:hypothetical protein [Bradyrhizobium centrosematis]
MFLFPSQSLVGISARFGTTAQQIAAKSVTVQGVRDNCVPPYVLALSIA